MTQWIAGITRGHNAGVCLLKDGEIVLAVEEERLSRAKYDGAPLLSINKILEFTDRLDYLVVAHTQLIGESVGVLEYCGQDPYTALARKHGLISREKYPGNSHPQVIDYGKIHHKLHAACAFYRSGFDKAVALVVDGAGTFIPMNINIYSIIKSLLIFSTKPEVDFQRQHFSIFTSIKPEHMPFEFRKSVY